MALFTQIIVRHLDTATAAERRLRAHTIAEAGLDAAVQQLDQGNWLGAPRPFPFQGTWPGGSFTGQVEDVPTASVVRVTMARAAGHSYRKKVL